MFEKLARERGIKVELDSAGTDAYHVGEAPDSRAQAEAKRHGYDLSSQRARQVHDEDFAHYDLLLAMDGKNLKALMARCPKALQSRLKLFMTYSPEHVMKGRLEVPDPYYGGSEGFTEVIKLIELASAGLCEVLS
ncbi:low molecular weight protein-tyrosine-phosphatase [Pokkaliibacter sp. CJK22405]